MTTEPETAVAEASSDMPAPSAGKKWYVVTTYSGYENKVKSALQERIRQHRMEDKFGEIMIPAETVTDTATSGRDVLAA